VRVGGRGHDRVSAASALGDDGAGRINIQEYLRLVRRRWLLIAVVTAAIVGMAVAQAMLATPRYESETKVLVQSEADSVDLQTERQVVLSTAVADRVRKKLRNDRPSTALLDDVKVSVPAETRVLVIAYSAPSPALAQEGAQAFAEQYLDYRQDAAVQAAASAGAAIQQRIGSVEAELRKLNASIAQLSPDSAEQQAAIAQRDSLFGELAGLRIQLASISNTPGSVGEIIDPADLPSQPASPKLLLNVLGGLFLGLLLAAVLAILRDRSVEALGGRDGFERLLDRPVLGAIPVDIASYKRTEPHVAILAEPDGPVAEAYRALATKLPVLAKRYDSRVVMVLSPSVGEGKSSVAANLAVALAEEGRLVLLISADVRKPRVHQLFGLNDEVGLLNVLADDIPIEEVWQPVSLDHRWDRSTEARTHLYVVPSGHAVTQSLRALGADAMANLLKLQREQFDFVLIDAPPALQVADALAIATEVDGVLVVADATTSKPEAIRRLMEQLEQVNANVLGGVLNRDEHSRWTRYYEPRG
jgi:capsular exopolysaccharide synthesis family protein